MKQILREDIWKRKELLFFAVFVLLLNSPSIIGFIRGFPIETEGRVVPAGSFFKGVPGLYNDKYINGGVFETIWTSSERFVNGENVYDLKPVGAGPFVYPPLLLLMGLPFLPFGWVTGYYLWTLLNLFMILFSAHVFLNIFFSQSADRYFGWFFYIFSAPLLAQLAWGHYIFLIMFFAIFLLKSIILENHWIEGISGGLLAAVSFISPFISAIIMSLRKIKTILIALGVFSLIFAVLLLNKNSINGLASLSLSGNPVSSRVPHANILSISEAGGVIWGALIAIPTLFFLEKNGIRPPKVKKIKKNIRGCLRNYG